MSNTVPTILLNDGLQIPAIGFGTYKLEGASGVTAIKDAIDVGYRLLDSAFNYENEGTLGRAVRESSIPRDQLFLCSKLPGRHHEYHEALSTIEESLYRTGVDYYDLYLIHWPNPRVNKYVDSWRALIEAKKRGYIRSIGVCNFLPEHINQLIAETDVCPSINQIELHPYFNQAPQRAWDETHNIVTQSWSPLGRGIALVKNDIIADIAQNHNKSASQIILRWHIQLKALPIPKATSQIHQIENLTIFDFQLTDDEMTRISSLTKPNGRNFNQDPTVYEEF
ncbi:aldo/keto reductase [Pectinatus frisingensis]|uniref:aldo/keto reductase n=1 Tax=Pectinatus frisingensis TaxID=865 RepID=UPI0015F438D8|nr:aldo/keto reductase [Pectinatus frisingensis]